MFTALLFVVMTLLMGVCCLKPTVVITGANRGIGLATIKNLGHEYNIVALCRSRERAEASLGGLSNVEIVEVDLASMESIKGFTDSWLKSGRKVETLVCNAGIQLSGGPKTACTRTSDGFEATVGINHIGHFLLANNLLPVVTNKVVWVGSGVHNPNEPGGDVGAKATLGGMQGLIDGFREPVTMVDGSAYDPDKAYKDSKLCNVVTSMEFARRLAKLRSPVSSNVMNPGLIPTTGLFRDLNPIFVFLFTIATRYIFKVAVSEEEGGRRLASLVSSNSGVVSTTGAYFSGKPGSAEFKPMSPSAEASDEAVGSLLFSSTADLVRPFLTSELKK